METRRHAWNVSLFDTFKYLLITSTLITFPKKQCLKRLVTMLMLVSNCRAIRYERLDLLFVADCGTSLKFPVWKRGDASRYVLIRFVALGCVMATICRFQVLRSVTGWSLICLSTFALLYDMIQDLISRVKLTDFLLLLFREGSDLFSVLSRGLGRVAVICPLWCRLWLDWFRLLGGTASPFPFLLLVHSGGVSVWLLIYSKGRLLRYVLSKSRSLNETHSIVFGIYKARELVKDWGRSCKNVTTRLYLH